MISREKTPRGTHRRAFTLIEVLMAVFILSIGLISLAAVFPAGIELQRRGADDLNSVTAANAMFGRLLGHPSLNSDRLNEGWTGMLKPGGTFGSTGTTWMTGIAEDASLVEPIELDEDGNLTLHVQYWDPTQVITFPLADRLWPSSGNPRYIWDLMLRRPDAVSGGLDAVSLATQMKSRMQIAIVFRRVDAGYKWDPNNPNVPPIKDRATGKYSMPRRTTTTTGTIYYRDAPADPEEEQFEWRGTPDVLRAVDQPRQKLVDSHGNVWRIARFRESGGTTCVQFAPMPDHELAMTLHDIGSDAMTFVYFDETPLFVEVRTLGISSVDPSRVRSGTTDDRPGG
ncbi:MAG: prepilin-type N-terminal cleavage/methylation domain-containing protein [Phycisphaerales bacterium]|nr:prepilin-type N-terminal cleavage/methylation domain-containing protein [Phycisphaerales bacterium]